jgi:CheY-like chemotaxis protein
MAKRAARKTKKKAAGRKTTKKKKKKKRKPRGGKVVAEVAEAYGINVEQDPKDRTLSPNEAGKVLGVTGEAVKQWIYARKLPAVKMSNGYWRVRVGDLEGFIRKRQEVSQRCVLLAGIDGASLKRRSQQLESLGHQVLVAEGLADALLKALDHYPSLFVIDISNWADGWVLADRVRSSRNIRTTHIMFMSSETLKEDQINKALELGVQGCLSDKIEEDSLRREVQKLLDNPK